MRAIILCVLARLRLNYFMAMLRWLGLILFASAISVNAADLPIAARKAMLNDMAQFGMTKVRAYQLQEADFLDDTYRLNLGSLSFFSSADGSLSYSSYRAEDLPQPPSRSEWAQWRREALAYLDERDMIVFAPKDRATDYTINVFMDVECPYCAELHQRIPELNAEGIKVRYLAYPNHGLDGKNYRDTQTVWCSENRALTLERIKRGMPVPAQQCAPNQVDAQYFLGESFGVRGTPSIVFENGALFTGSLSTLDILAYVTAYLPPPECSSFTQAPALK